MKAKVILPNNNGIESIETFEGETIEEKVERIVTNKEPISDGAPMIYTEKVQEYYLHIILERIDSILQ